MPDTAGETSTLTDSTTSPQVPPKMDAVPDLALRGVIGVGALLSFVGLLVLCSGDIGAAFGMVATGLVFAGMGWAGRQFMRRGEPGQGSLEIHTVGGALFGGVGILMLMGSIALGISGDALGAVGLGIFGLVFCGAGYAGYRLFLPPKGTKAILVTQHRQPFQEAGGQTGQRTSRTYRYVDATMPEAEVERLQRQWVEAPWTQREDWAAGLVVQEGPGSMRLLIGFTVVWNVFAWGFAGFFIWSDWGSGDVPWFMLLFPLAGLALAAMTVRTWIRRRKFGISVFTLKAVPAYLGGRLQGLVETGVPGRDAPMEGFRVQLACIERHSYRDRDGERRVSEEERWHEEQYVHGRMAGPASHATLPIDFMIPVDMPPTEMLPEDDRILWRLAVSASTPGVDYAAQFEVPVFSRDASSP